MATPNLTFNLLTFTHPAESLTLWFTDQEQDGLCRIFNTQVPYEVIEKFGEQEHYYTSFEKEHDEFFAVTKNTVPDFEYLTDDDGVGKSVRQQNLPVTIKYPEMVAEIFPHFSGHEIPEFGKDNLWFL